MGRSSVEHMKTPNEDQEAIRIDENYSPESKVTLYPGDCAGLLSQISEASKGKVQLVVTSPPYNIGKRYEKRIKLEEYVKQQTAIIDQCVELLDKRGSICWQVGNYVRTNEIDPLDILLFPAFKRHNLKLRNRIVWHFGHGLHSSKRLSGRYETILWFTKSNDYVFNLDPIRVEQKYPGKKYFKGPKKGQYSSHPLGKNPTDVWNIPNVKYNHPEKTIHPCQFPVELIERLILSLTNEGDLVVDPFIGVGTTAVASVLHNRRVAGAEIVPEYMEIAKERVRLASNGNLKTRPMDRPIFEPPKSAGITRKPKRTRIVKLDDGL